jgi:hypothetical protein
MKTKILGIAALVFGVMTLVEGGKVIFGGPESWEAAGNVVPWVLYFNFAAGFVYILTGILTLLKKKASAHFALAIAVGSLVVLLGLGVHITMGLPFEPRTAVAMTIRTLFWSGQFWLLRKLMRDI